MQAIMCVYNKPKFLDAKLFIVDMYNYYKIADNCKTYN